MREKLLEVKGWTAKYKCRVEIKYVIQHFCIETWFLGNKTIFKNKPKDKELNDYLKIFDVRVNDPELLPENKR